MLSIEFFPQGGLGNQIIQHAYLASLINDSGFAVNINSVLLTKSWAKFRRISWREPSRLVSGYHPSAETRLSKLAGLTRLQLALRTHQCITDQWDHAQVVSLLSRSTSYKRLQMYGYFQRHQAFSSSNEAFWRFLAFRLRSTHTDNSIAYPPEQIAIHARLGDYRKPENLGLFFQPNFNELLTVAFHWRSLLGKNYPINIVTDDPRTLDKEIPPVYRDDVSFLTGASAEDDFCTLSRHRNLVISNSTFSLCAGRLSSELWGASTTVAHPGRWFLDSTVDAKHQHELEQCSFCVTFDELLS